MYDHWLSSIIFEHHADYNDVLTIALIELLLCCYEIVKEAKIQLDHVCRELQAAVSHQLQLITIDDCS